MEVEALMIRYPHLNLTDWPFRVVPDVSFYAFMADRKWLIQDIRVLLRNLSRRPTSSMHLMWAWFGAGKTHTLHHIEHLCKSEFDSIIPIYVEFPRSAKNFLDVYRTFISRIPIEVINNAYLEVFTSPEKERFQKDLQFDFQDLSNALMLLYGGKEQQRQDVLRWLRAELTDKAAMKNIGILRPIKTAEDALRVITWIINLINMGGQYSVNSQSRVLWMMDEFQRITHCRSQVREDISSCLTATFNRCPNALSIIISFSGLPEQDKLPAWISPELRDRIGIEKVLLLPPLTTDDTMEFIKDVLTFFRADKELNGNVYFPFSEEAVRTIIQVINNNSNLKPRSIMQFFNAVLEEAEMPMEQKHISTITADFAEDVLKGRVFIDDDDT